MAAHTGPLGLAIFLLSRLGFGILRFHILGFFILEFRLLGVALFGGLLLFILVVDPAGQGYVPLSRHLLCSPKDARGEACKPEA